MEFSGDVEMDLAESVPAKEKQERPEGGVSPNPKRARLDHARIIHLAEQVALRDHALADLAKQVRLRDLAWMFHLAEQARLRHDALAEGSRLDEDLTSPLADLAEGSRLDEDLTSPLADLAEGSRLDEDLTSPLAERARLRDHDLAKSVESLISDLAQEDEHEDVDDYDDEDQSSVEDDDEDQSSVEDDSDDEEEEETTVPRTRCEEVPMTEEEKELSLFYKKYMMDGYGTTDLATIDYNISTALLDLYGPEEDEDEDEDKHRDTEDQGVLQILKDVDCKSAFVGDVNCHSGNVPPVKSFLLYPWDDLECTRQDLTVRSLDIYYKRLFPNVESARRHFHHRLWNRLPEVDLQYVQLFNKLNTLFEQKSCASFRRTAMSYEFMKAKEIAEDLELQKLSDEDISDCAYDVFREWDTIAAHKLKTDYDLFLLQCQLSQNLSPGDFIPDDPSEICRSAARFCPQIQQWDFKKWMDEEKLLERSEEECISLIIQRQVKNLEENCSTRIRYIKFKRALAKDLKLISEETD